MSKIVVIYFLKYFTIAKTTNTKESITKKPYKYAEVLWTILDSITNIEAVI